MKNAVRLETLRDVVARRVGGLSALVREQRTDPDARLHRCAGFGCRALIARDRLMCGGHWQMLPAWLHGMLAGSYNPHDEFAWPVHLVEEAIRTTISADDLRAMFAQIEESLQEDLFIEARCGIEVCHSHLHCDLCDHCSVTTKMRLAVERFSHDRVDLKSCTDCAQIVAAGRHAVFESVGKGAAWRQDAVR